MSVDEVLEIKKDSSFYMTGKHKDENEEMPFNLLVAKIRRKYLLQGLAAKDVDKKIKGLRILKNVANLIKIYRNN